MFCSYVIYIEEYRISVSLIRKTGPCNIPLKPHFCIVKLWFVGVYLFFLFLLQNIDCGYSLEPPRFFDIFFLKNIKKILMKFSICTGEKNLCNASEKYRIRHDCTVYHIKCANMYIDTTKKKRK